MKFLDYLYAEHPDVAVVVITAPDDLRRAVLATISGASGYIQTPLQPEAVAAVLRSSLDRKQSEFALLDQPLGAGAKNGASTAGTRVPEINLNLSEEHRSALSTE
jgi:DNA-binding NtrC family response regulator